MGQTCNLCLRLHIAYTLQIHIHLKQPFDFSPREECCMLFKQALPLPYRMSTCVRLIESTYIL